MPAYDAEFQKLHDLLAAKDGDFRLHYKIGPAATLTIYEVLNSPRVDSYLKLRGLSCEPVKPGRLDASAADKRLSIAVDIARSKDVQNKDYNFSGTAVQAFTAAKPILTDAARHAAYRKWAAQKNSAGAAGTDDSEMEAERARRREAEKERKKLRRELEEAKREKEQLAREAAEAKREKERLEREAAARALSDDDEEEQQSSSPSGWDVFANILQRAVASRVGAAAAPAPAPSTPQVNVTGAWGSMDGMRYEFAQYGSNVRMVVRNPFGIVTTEGEGTIVSGRMNISFRALTPMGVTQGAAEAQVSSDGRSIQGYWQNYTLGVRGPVNLYR